MRAARLVGPLICRYLSAPRRNAASLTRAALAGLMPRCAEDASRAPHRRRAGKRLRRDAADWAKYAPPRAFRRAWYIEPSPHYIIFCAQASSDMPPYAVSRPCLRSHAQNISKIDSSDTRQGIAHESVTRLISSRGRWRERAAAFRRRLSARLFVEAWFYWPVTPLFCLRISRFLSNRSYG